MWSCFQTQSLQFSLHLRRNERPYGIFMTNPYSATSKPRITWLSKPFPAMWLKWPIKETGRFPKRNPLTRTRYAIELSHYGADVPLAESVKRGEILL